MEPGRPNDDEDEEKLIPEWSLGADDQILWVGLAVFAALALLAGWNVLRGDGDGGAGSEVLAGPLTSVIPEGQLDDAEAAARAVAGTSDGATTTEAPATTEAPTTTEAEAAVTTTTAEPTTTSAAPTIGDVQAAVSAFPGAITGTNDGSTAVLEGFVANQGESDEAETAAGAVEGIESVDNGLVILEPSVAAALDDGGVVDGAASGVGTVLTVTGSLQSEDDRAPVIAAAEGVEGVTEVVDELTVSVAAELNALPQVQFATSSAIILSESFEDLDAAAELISGSEGVALRVEGYTDIIGPAAANRRLSTNRANAVRDYLIGAGVDPSVLTAEGFGETEQFATGNSDEALAANRLVRFVEVG